MRSVFLSLLILETNYLVIMDFPDFYPWLYLLNNCILSRIVGFTLHFFQLYPWGKIWNYYSFFLLFSPSLKVNIQILTHFCQNQVAIFFFKMRINDHKEIRILFCLFFLSQGLLLGPFLKAYMKNLFLIDHK